jgi:hypothetical protein
MLTESETAKTSITNILGKELEKVLRKIFCPDFEVSYLTSNPVWFDPYVELIVKSNIPMHTTASGKLAFMSICPDGVEVWNTDQCTGSVTAVDSKFTNHPLSSPRLFEDVLNKTCEIAKAIINAEVIHLRKLSSMNSNRWIAIQSRIDSRCVECLQEAFEHV